MAKPASSIARKPKPQAETAGTLRPGAPTVTVHDEVLFGVCGSGVVETTVAVLEKAPVAPGLATTRAMVADAPFAIVPKEQVTTLVKVQVPCDGVAET